MSKTKIVGICVALCVHVAVYTLMVHPMTVNIGNDSALTYIIPSIVLYLPISVLAWGLAMATHSTQLFAWTLLFVGGIWYCFVGFWIGKKVELRRVHPLPADGNR